MRTLLGVSFILANLFLLVACGSHSLGVGLATKTDSLGVAGATPTPSPTITGPSTSPTPTPTATPTPAPDVCNGYAGNYAGKCGASDTAFTVANVNNVCTFTASTWFEDVALDMTNPNAPKATLKDKTGGPALSGVSLTLDGLAKQFTIKAFNYAGNFSVTCHEN